MEETDDICFVCDKEISSDKWKYKLKVTATKKRKVPAADLINHLVGEEYAVLVGERDAVCKKCMNMLNLMDSLTDQLSEVTDVLKLLLRIKYNLRSDDQSVPFQVDYDDSVLEEPLYKCSACKFQTKYEKEFNMHKHKHTKISPEKKLTQSKATKTLVFNKRVSHKKKSLQIQPNTTPTTITLAPPAKSGHRTRSTTNSLKKKKKISLGYEEKHGKKSLLKITPKPKKSEVFFQCSLCEKVFPTENSIKVHAEKVHGKENIKVTEEEEYTDIQTLESDHETPISDRNTEQSENNAQSLDFLDDWEEDEANDEVTSPAKRKEAESFKHQQNESSKQDSKNIKKKSGDILRKKSFSFSEEDDYDDDKNSSSKPTCLFCHAVFSSLDSVQDHIKMMHREKSSYSSSTLKKNSTNTITSFEIDSTTDVTAPKESPYISGINGISKQKTYKCNVCGIKKVSLQFIQKHVKGHKRKMSLQCKFCGVCCKNVVGLKVHGYKCNKVAPVSKKCGYCKFRFVGSYQLKTHTRKVHKKTNLQSSIRNASNFIVSNTKVPDDSNQLYDSDQNLLKKSKAFNKRYPITDSRKISFSEVSSTSLETETESRIKVKSEVPKQNTEKWCCQECSLTFKKPVLLQRHVIRHKVNNCLDLGICIYCNKMFLSKDQVVLHNNVVHEELKTTPKCGLCGKTYSYLKDLKNHYVASHCSEKMEKLIQLATELRLGINSENFNSTDSGDGVSKRLKDFQGLNRKHNDIDVVSQNLQPSNMTYSCPLCSFDSADKEVVGKHLSTHTKNYCLICSNIFNSQECIKHIENHSVVFQGKNCSVCDSQFHDDVHLQFHLQNAHPSGKKDNNKCSMCTNTYLSQRSLLIHKHKKHAQKTVKVLSCNKCNMKFFSEKKYQTHIEFAHRPSLNCKYCDKGFGEIKTLVLHEKNHLKQVKSIYKCSICGKVLKSLLTLKTHKTNHANGSPLQCEACGRNFKSFYALREHSAKHSDTLEMKYFCDICGKGFYFYDSHCRHRRIHLELLKFQ